MVKVLFIYLFIDMGILMKGEISSDMQIGCAIIVQIRDEFTQPLQIGYAKIPIMYTSFQLFFSCCMVFVV